jgi:hypothetical protein
MKWRRKAGMRLRKKIKSNIENRRRNQRNGGNGHQHRRGGENISVA